MLDLNYLRENLDKVRAALAARGATSEALDHFSEADAERRRIIAESDQLNATRNAASREIGALMKDGKRDRSEEHTSELQSPCNLVCRLLLEKKKKHRKTININRNQSTV